MSGRKLGLSALVAIVTSLPLFAHEAGAGPTCCEKRAYCCSIKASCCRKYVMAEERIVPLTLLPSEATQPVCCDKHVSCCSIKAACCGTTTSAVLKRTDAIPDEQITFAGDGDVSLPVCCMKRAYCCSVKSPCCR